MKTGIEREMPKQIATGFFLMVITGECYDTKVVAGDKLVEAYIGACYDPKEEAPEEVVQQTVSDLANLDNWGGDPDIGPTYYKEAFEIGAIEFIRLSGYAIESVAPIAVERERQIDGEKWTPSHDDKHAPRELARAALGYTQHYVGRAHAYSNEFGLPGIVDGPKEYREEPAPDSWPWDEKWWKPKDPMRDIVRAGALIAAEIGKLQRKKP